MAVIPFKEDLARSRSRDRPVKQRPDATTALLSLKRRAMWVVAAAALGAAGLIAFQFLVTLVTLD